MLAFLVMLQVLIGTLGQGALTLCVRRDGTQHLELTALSDCKAQAGQLHEGTCCHEDEYLAVAPADQIGCDPCTDYLLIVDPSFVQVSKYEPLDSQAVSFLDCITTSDVVFGQIAVSFAAFHGPPRLFSTPSYLATVVLRC